MGNLAVCFEKALFKFFKLPIFVYCQIPVYVSGMKGKMNFSCRVNQ